MTNWEPPKVCWPKIKWFSLTFDRRFYQLKRTTSDLWSWWRIVAACPGWEKRKDFSWVRDKNNFSSNCNLEIWNIDTKEQMVTDFSYPIYTLACLVSWSPMQRQCLWVRTHINYFKRDSSSLQCNKRDFRRYAISYTVIFMLTFS